MTCADGPSRPGQARRSASGPAIGREATDLFLEAVGVAAHLAVLGGVDALVFTDDVGLHNWLLREKVCADMSWCGIALDAAANRRATGEEISILSAPGSRVKVLAVPTEEELVICWEGMRLKEASHAAPVRS